MKAPEKRRQTADAAAQLVRKLGRKAITGQANDRVYDRELEQKLRRMSAEQVDALLRNDD